MAESFPFRLITPAGVVLEEPVEEVVGLSTLGEFGVLANHINFITSLIPGVLRIRIDGQRSADYVVIGGLAAVNNGAMTVLAPEVQLPENVDPTAAGSEARAAEERLGQISYYAADYADDERALQVARAREQASESRRGSR
jgi:F-type H+-transporting ATPase subunit epsilon